MPISLATVLRRWFASKVQSRRDHTRKRSSLRKTLLEGLERREMMNAAPIVQNDAGYFTALNTDLVVTTSSTPAQLLANDIDVDGGSISATVVTGPSHGTLVGGLGTNGTFTYRPTTGYTGIDTFTYKVNDGTNDSNTGTVSIAVGTRLLAKQNLDSDSQFASSIITPSDSDGLGGDGDITADPTSGGLILNEDVVVGLNMVYRSNTGDKPVIVVETQLAPGLAVPSAMTAQLTFNGVAGTSYSYNTSGMAAGQTLRFALPADGTSLSPGMYSYSVAIGATVGGVVSSQTFTGTQAIVKRTAGSTPASDQEFGRGWFVDGVDRIYEQTTGNVGALLVKGDGDYLWFPKVGSTFQAAAGDLSNQTLAMNGTAYKLTDKFGTVKNFNSSGLMISVVDSNAVTTTYNYTSNRLTSIVDKHGTTTLSYTSGLISSIQDYASRTTNFTLTSGNLTKYQLTDPDGVGALPRPEYNFGYTSNQVTSRINTPSTGVTETTSFSYNSNDARLRTITYPDSNTKQLVPIESIGFPTAPTGNTVKKIIDAQASLTDERNNVTTQRTDRFGAITESITALGFVTTILRDSNGREYVRNLPDPDGAGPLTVDTVTTGYDIYGNETYLAEPASGVQTWTFSSGLNRMLSATDALSRTHTYTYDVNGNRLTDTDPAGYVTTYAYNSHGFVTSITQPDPDGAGALTAPVTGYTLDTADRVTTQTNPDSTTQTFTYNSANQQLTAVDELSKTTTNTYDTLGRLTKVTNRLGKDTQYTYDSMSRKITETDALGNLTTTAYNNRGWISTITYPDPDGAGTLASPVETRTYYPNGLTYVTSVPESNYTTSSTVSYDSDNEVVSLNNPALPTTLETYSYDHRGRLTSIVAPNMNGTVLTYDAAGRLLSRVQNAYYVPPASPTIYAAVYYTYDVAGEKLTQTDGRGNVTSYSYNSRGLLATETQPDPDGSGSQFGNIITHSYDNIGREISRFDGYDRTLTAEYNSRGWLTKVTDQDPDGAGSATAPVTQYGYNNRGDQTTATDPLGRVTTMAYDNEQRVTSVTYPDPDGAGGLVSPVESTTYNDVGWVLSKTDKVGGVTTYTYDNLGRVLTQTDPDPDGAGSLTSPVTTNVYAADGLQKTTDPMGHYITYTHDGDGHVATETDNAGNVTSYTYNYYGQLTSKTTPDPDGAGAITASVTTYSYDAAKRLVGVTDPLSGSTGYSYDAAGNEISTHDPDGNYTYFSYDGQNRLVMNTNQLSKTKSYYYDVSGNLTHTVDRDGNDIQYVYDGLDRVTDEKWQNTTTLATLTVGTTQQGGPVNEVQRVGWTASGSPSGTFTLSFGGQTTSALAANATAAQVATALQALSTIGSGNISVTLSAPAPGYSSTYSLTFQGTLSSTNVAQVTINVSGLSYYPGATPTAVQATDVNGAGVVNETQSLVLANATSGTWRLAYNGEVTSPLAYNASAANVESALEALVGIDDVTVTGSSGSFSVTFGGTQANTNVAQILGDAANALSGTTVRTITTAYNAADEVTSVTDPDSTITYTRDNLGRATGISNVITGLTPTVALSQAFDAADNRTELKATSGGTLDFKNNYTYDTLQRLTDIIQQGQSGGNSVTSKHVTIGYNALSQQTAISRYQSTGTTNPVASTAFTYDTLNRIDTMTHKQGSTTLDSYDYDFDGMSRVTKITNGIDGVANYTYDKTSQLTAADNPSPLTDESYSYDANGNRTSTGYTINSNNQTAASPGYTYTYDDEGNRTKRTETASGHVEEYTYDYRNRLTTVKFRNTAMGSIVKEVDYSYDYKNRMVKRSYDADGAGAGAPTYQYWIYDDSINAVLQFDGASASNLSHRYLWANDVDALLADEQVTSLGSGGNTLWALADKQGSIRDIADLNEGTGVTSVTNHRTYNSFGKLTSETNAAVDLVFGYTGKYLDDATTYQNNVNRWYDSNLGQWLSEDPIGFAAGDGNLRRYVYNNVVQRTDWLGLQTGTSGESGDSGSSSGFSGSAESEEDGTGRIGAEKERQNAQKDAKLGIGGYKDVGKKGWGYKAWAEGHLYFWSPNYGGPLKLKNYMWNLKINGHTKESGTPQGTLEGGILRKW